MMNSAVHNVCQFALGEMGALWLNALGAEWWLILPVEVFIASLIWWTSMEAAA